MSMKQHMHEVVINNNFSAGKPSGMIADEETLRTTQDMFYEVNELPVTEFITMEQEHFTEAYVNPDHDVADEADIAAFLAAF